MKNLMLIKLFSLFLCVVILLFPMMLPASAVTIYDTVLGEDTDYIYGYHHKYVHWSITKSTGELYIYGNENENYDDPNVDPSFYYTHHIARFTEYIKTVRVGKGVFFVKENALAGLPFERAEIENGVKRIEDGAFRDCDNLKKLVIPASVEYIGRGAFDGCDSLERIYIFADNIVIDEGAFPDSLNLKAVYFYGKSIEIKENNEHFAALAEGFKTTGKILPAILALVLSGAIAAAFVVCTRISKKSRRKAECRIQNDDHS